MTHDIPAIIADLRSRMARLPKIDSSRGDIMEQHRQLRSASEELGEQLTSAYGARITIRPDTNRIKMCGITSSSTGGLVGAFGNWIAAAEKKAARL